MPDIVNSPEAASSSALQLENKAPTVPHEAKTADRPHRLTLFASFGSLILSIISLLISLGSTYFTRLSMHVGQRAYLSFTPTFPAYNDEPTASADDTVVLPANIEVKNLGNTPAYNIRSTISPGEKGSLYQILSAQSVIPAIGPKDTGHIQFSFSGSRQSYRNSLKWPGAAPSMCATVIYADVFGDTHSDSSCFNPHSDVIIEMYNPPRHSKAPSEGKK